MGGLTCGETEMLFDSRFTIGPTFLASGEQAVKAEPMLFSADAEFAEQHGGPLTRAFLHALAGFDNWGETLAYGRVVLDSRTHMLMPGWYPCIPGWHLDDVPRTRNDGQPDHAHPRYRAEHVMAIVGDASRTHFIDGPLRLKDIPDGGLEAAGATSIYGSWHPEVERLCEERRVFHRQVPTETLIGFDWQTFHRGERATKHGWRWFIRASRYTDRPALNELRTQVQVYLPAPEAGW